MRSKPKTPKRVDPIVKCAGPPIVLTFEDTNFSVVATKEGIKQWMREVEQIADRKASLIATQLREAYAKSEKQVLESLARTDDAANLFPAAARELGLEEEKALTLQALRELELDITLVPKEMSNTIQSSLENVKAAISEMERLEAEGAEFRRQFLKMTPKQAWGRLTTQPTNSVWWLAGFSGDPDARRKLQKNQRKGAETNKTAKATRKVEACAIYAAPNPETGKPWETKDECITYLMGTHTHKDERGKTVTNYGWSRAAINEYLPKNGRRSRRRNAP